MNECMTFSGLRIYLGHRRPGDSYSKYRAPHVLALSHDNPGARTPMKPRAPKQSNQKPPTPRTEAGDGTSVKEPRWQLTPGEGRERRRQHSPPMCPIACTLVGNLKPFVPAGNWHTRRRPEKGRQTRGNVHSPTADNIFRHQ